MENFITIGEAANKVVARLRAERRPPSEVILFASNMATTIDTPVPPRTKRRESNRNAGYGQ